MVTGIGTNVMLVFKVTLGFVCIISNVGLTTTERMLVQGTLERLPKIVVLMDKGVVALTGVMAVRKTRRGCT